MIWERMSIFAIRTSKSENMYKPNNQELCDIKNLIAEYFSNKALDAMDRLCEDGTLSTETIQSWQLEHMRTPYKY